MSSCAFSATYISGAKKIPHILDTSSQGLTDMVFFTNFAPVKRQILLIFLALLCTLPLNGQAKRKVTGTPMCFEVINGDTVYYEQLDPVWIFPKGKGMKGADWRKQYKLVYNFNKVYPYALVGRKLMAQVDSTLEADVSKRSQRNQYVKDVERELLRLFEKDIRNMTISQGMVLLRLVDRECGLSGYEIIKTYESGFAAAFWQLVAKLFSHNLKTKYDPTGKDKSIEDLVRIWESGRWDNFYFSIFWEYPVKTEIKVERLNSSVKK